MRKLLFKGPVLTASGYGVHARQILRALLAIGKYDIGVKQLTWGNTAIIHDDDPFLNTVRELSQKYETRPEGTQYDVSVQVTIPNEFEKLARVNVGITAGIEVTHVSPLWVVKANDEVDILFVPSQHSKEVFEKTEFRDQAGNVLKLNKPARIAHEGFDHRIYNTDVVEGPFDDFAADFNFLFVGLGIDSRLGQERKNISSLVKWFCETFKDRKDVGLVLKTAVVNGSLMDFEHTKMRIRDLKKQAGCGEYPRIELLHGRLSDQEMALLYKNPKVKCLVSLTHGEGFGLPMLEAAACGLPVMATNWSGHLDFLRLPDGSKSFIELDYELTAVPDSALWEGVIERGTGWASPKEDDVKIKLRKMFASPEKPREWASKLAVHVRENFAEPVVGYKFAVDLFRLVEQHVWQNPRSSDEVVQYVKRNLPKTDRKTLLYTMPMSAGDVYISTGVVSSLKKKFPDHDILFATNPEYLSILEGNEDITAILNFQEWMTNVPVLEQAFDEVYTPNLAVQMTFSNWVHGGKGRLLGDELAHQCGVEYGEPFIKLEPYKDLPDKYMVLHPGSGKGQWEARNYLHWQEVVINLVRELGDIKIVQVGLTDDPLYQGCVDLRGKTNYNQLAYVVSEAEALLGIDSVTMHMAAGLGIPHIALFGSSYAKSTGPTSPRNLSVLMETPTRYSCDKACYKYQCSVDREHPCINEISPRNVYLNVMNALELDQGTFCLERYIEVRPTISGYTQVLDAKKMDIPYMECIQSLLGFCDEVVVVDAGSTDGTYSDLLTLAAEDPRVKVYDHEFDNEEPCMDGMLKAYARAMCSGEFLWQTDADEIVHEDDYEKIRNLVKRFPKDVDIVHLPIVELWGDEKHVRTDRHSWKWRLSRNNFRITHGVNKDARCIDEKTGKLYAKRGQSDAAEMIDIMTHEHLPHKGFYSRDLEHLRVNDPQEYGRRMNDFFDQLPVVFHYSWLDIERKIKNFKMFWEQQWGSLYKDVEDRFPQVKDENDLENIQRVAAEVKARGGEHGAAETFELRRSNPKVMEAWLAAR
jgi:ADP-heptose:LPS heptosyltransferase/glycosyltransferase involved in cell wall biosynthesis